MAVAVPLATAMLFVMYVDQRVRQDGLTIGALARELGEPDAQASRTRHHRRGPRRRRRSFPAGGCRRGTGAVASIVS